MRESEKARAGIQPLHARLLREATMTIEKTEVLNALRRVRGPDLDSNIVDLKLVSDIIVKDGRVYFSITVPAARAADLEDLRKAAEKVVSEVQGVSGVTAVLTADAAPGAARPQAQSGGVTSLQEHKRVQEARARGTAGDGACDLRRPDYRHHLYPVCCADVLHADFAQR